MTDILRRTIALKCSKPHAFRVFTEMTDLWWPRTHRRDTQSKLILDPTKGGALVERGEDGAEWTIGNIIDIDPPNLLTFAWFPAAPNAPTHVRVTFEGDAKSAQINITHSAVSDAAQQIWPEKVALFTKGWDTILPPFAKLCAETFTTESKPS